MAEKLVRCGEAEIALLIENERFVGLGACRIGGRAVRSGRLPIAPTTQSFGGLELSRLDYLGHDAEGAGIRVRLRAIFRPLPVKLMRDHSFDPIHELGDWTDTQPAGEGQLDLVLQPASDRFGDADFTGFSYHYEYASEAVPLFYLLDRASWELDGDIAGATVVSQSSCSDPVVTFGPETKWSTEGVIHWDPDMPNPIMTHNLPRWASHQAFDFQYRDGATLIGVFARVGLIRSTLRREPGKAELKCFDKHVFDQANRVATIPKAILLSAGQRSAVGQRNLWTHVIDEVHERARAEYGLAEEPTVPYVGQNYWVNFTIDTYYKDLVPCAASLGVGEIFIDNIKKSAMTEKGPQPSWNWNMCCGHEYEIAPSLGGNAKCEELVKRCREQGVRVMSWTNNDQALSSPINRHERDENGWYVLLEDTRQKYGGAYAGCMSILDYKHPDAYRYFVDTHIKIKEETGLDKYLFDSFYNLGFMPVSYRNGKPATMWRELLLAFKELQDAGVHFRIESFGPFGQPMHGCPKSYCLEDCWVVYKVQLGTGYTTVPGSQELKNTCPDGPATLYYTLAHKTLPAMPLFVKGERLDRVWGAEERRVIDEYQQLHQQMHRRYLQEDGQSILWHDRDGKQALLFNFTDRQVTLPAPATELATGQTLPAGTPVKLKATHTYRLEATPLSVTL